MRYLLKFNPAIRAQTLEQSVVESDGFSFAQLREVAILAAQSAFERKVNIDPDDLLHAVRTLRQTTARSSVHSKFAGFEKLNAEKDSSSRCSFPLDVATRACIGYW